MKSTPLSIYLGVLLTMTNPVSAEGLASTVEVINPYELFDPSPFGFSHAAVANHGKRIAFIAGQGGEDSTGTLHENFEVQVRQAYQNLLIALKSAGATPESVTKLTTYVVDYDQSKLEVMSRELQWNSFLLITLLSPSPLPH